MQKKITFILIFLFISNYSNSQIGSITNILDSYNHLAPKELIFNKWKKGEITKKEYIKSYSNLPNLIDKKDLSIIIGA
jgi:uncharacterized membrane protein